MIDMQNYYETKDGNIIPYDKVLFVHMLTDVDLYDEFEYEAEVILGSHAYVNLKGREVKDFKKSYMEWLNERKEPKK